VTVDPAQHVGAQAALLLIAPAPARFFGANDLDPLSLTCDACANVRFAARPDHPLARWWMTAQGLLEPSDRARMNGRFRRDSAVGP
jgi:hypothetical protein